MTTKEKILQESMKLFSVQGYDKVTVRMIGEAVGVRNSALYKHFPSKQAIFDAIVETSKAMFLQKYRELDMTNENLDGLKEMCLKMFAFQTENEWIVMFRRMLIMEQFKNPQMEVVYKELFIDMPLKGQTLIFKGLMEEGMIKNRNPEVMALELYAPFFLYHTVECDKKNLKELFSEHVDNFIELFFETKC